MDNLMDLFVHELKDIYDAEKRALKALDEQATTSTAGELKEMFVSHREETRGQVRRLEEVFRTLGEKVQGHECKGMKGLIEERADAMEEKPSAEVRDVINATAAMKVERYEITAYESLVRIARTLDMDEVADTLEETLDEEEAALERLEEFLDEISVPEKEERAPARSR